ncbi:hypothetical protein ACVXG7_31965 [Enterobacter hormaechei]
MLSFHFRGETAAQGAKAAAPAAEPPRSHRGRSAAPLQRSMDVSISFSTCMLGRVGVWPQ